MNSSRLQILLTVLPLLSAGLYLMGATYHQGYLEAFGLDDSLFALSLEKALLTGFVALVTVGALPMFYLWLATLALTIFALFVTAVLSHPRFRRLLSDAAARVRNRLPRPALSTIATEIVDRSASAYTHSGFALLTLLLLLFVAVLSAQSGREQGFKEARNFAERKGNYVTLYSARLDGPIVAKQIFCNASHCAFWLGTEGVVLRHEDIERLVTHSAKIDSNP